jgi:hypothetical protein
MLPGTVTVSRKSILALLLTAGVLSSASFTAGQEASWQQLPKARASRTDSSQARKATRATTDAVSEADQYADAAARPAAARKTARKTRTVALEEEQVPESAELSAKPIAPVPGQASPAPRPRQAQPGGYIEDELSGYGNACGGGQCDEGCETGCGPMRYPCNPLWGRLHNRLWFRTEYLMWWTQGMGAPPLLTEGSPNDPRPGALDQPGTTILYPTHALNRDLRSGGRLSFGMWLDPCLTSGIEFTYLGLGKDVERFEQSSNGTPLLTRPFFNVGSPNSDPPIQGGFQDAELVASTERDLAGTFTSTSSTEFQGGGVLWRRALACGCDCGRQYRVDFVAGYRFLRLDDNLRLNEDLLVGGVAPEPVAINLFDEFDTRNDFHGGELGVVAEYRGCRWSLEGRMKLALGNTWTRTSIKGETSFDGGAPQVGGLFAQRSNIGVYDSNQFSVVPELGLTVGYALTPRLRATFGYTFIYWSNVARAGDQIDTDVDPGQLPNVGGPGVFGERPAFALRTGDFWAQGMNFGLDWRF